MASSICRWAVVVSLLLVVLMGGPAARAEPPAGTSREVAQAKLIEGVALLKQGDYTGALATFQDAYRLVPSPNIHYDMALAYAGLGRSADALEAFERFLAEAPRAPPATRQKAKRDAETMRGRVGVVAISADQPGAEIFVDGASRGVTPLSRSLYLDPGPHALAARGPGGALGPAQTVVVEAGATAKVALQVPTAAAAPALAGTTVEVPGRIAPPAPAPAATVVAPEPRAAATRSSRIWALSSTAVGVALLGLGGTFGLLARQEGESLTKLSEQSKPNNEPPFPVSTESRGLRYEDAGADLRGGGRGGAGHRGDHLPDDRPARLDRAGHQRRARRRQLAAPV